MSENHHQRAAQYNSIEVSERQIEATLSLAYEQRTANLIAFLQTGPHSWGYHPGEGVLKHVQGQIEERLGMV